MKKISIFMFCVFVHFVNASESKRQISFFVQPSNEHIVEYFQNPHDFVRVLPVRKERLQVFQDITKKFDADLIDRQKAIESFLILKNVNKRRCFKDGYTLHNKNGIITESHSGKISRSFYARDVQDVICNNGSVEIILK